MKTQTLTIDCDEPDITATAVHARLVFLGDTEHPQLASSTHSLAELDEVRFRRGSRSVERANGVLTLTFPDARMSSDHGRLIRHDMRWLLDDPASKNGTIVDGVPTRRTLLSHGALLELGRSFFTFTQASLASVPAYLAGDVAADQLPAWPCGMATFSPVLGHTFEALAQLAACPEVSIVLFGETGTGKEVVANAVHELSQRTGELVAVNCGAVTGTLIESELFGHRKGAFTGATSDRKGLVRTADSGTLFLDEIGDLPAALQTAFLRVLQEREVLPVGEDRPSPVNLRVIVATHRDLEAAIEQGDFRQDLYVRVAGHVSTLLPLRDRREDFGLLVSGLLSRLATTRVRLSAPAFRALLRHPWPGNIRELEKALIAAIALARTGVIELEHLPAAVRTPRPPPKPIATSVQELDLDDEDRELRERLVALFVENTGKVVRVAEAMGKERQQIYKWIRRLGIDPKDYRPAR